MSYPNTLIFMDFASDDTEASAAFYAEVMGWEVEPRPAGKFHRIVPGQNFQLDDGTQSPVGNLHMGIYDAADGRPNPSSYSSAELTGDRRGIRCYVLVSDDDSQDRILDTAERLGATVLWRNHYWGEFNGFNGAFRDPWGNEIILWTKAGDDPVIPEGYTSA
ncbi:MAG: VOC family protein [Acidimicrobiales bacterium]|nr:VOC family protein [Acidimicrobiales bacterium]